MNYTEFIEQIELSIKMLVDNESEVLIRRNLKNNNTTKVGVIIKNKDKTVAPTIYLEKYYCEYLDGRDINLIVSEIIIANEIAVLPEDVMIRKIDDVDFVKSKIAFQLINKEKNKLHLENVPNRNWMDLSITYFVLLDIIDEGMITMKINYNHMKSWGICEEELFELAMHNTPKLLPYKIETIGSVLSSVFDMDNKYETFKDDGMYILTNTYASSGAGCIYYPGMLERIYDKINEEYYVLPSSIDELIILPKKYVDTVEEILETVRSINITQVSGEDVLSNNVYLYEKGKSLQLYD